MTRSDALKLEYRVKQVPAQMKHVELTKGGRVMKNLRKDLQAVTGEIKALIKKLEAISVAVGKMGKPKAAKRAAARKTATKKPARIRAIGTIFGLIERSKNGVSAAQLMKETGFDKQKVYNIVSGLKKQERIKAAGRGVYVTA